MHLRFICSECRGGGTMRREFYYQDETSNKFWTIERVGTTCITTNGRIGASPRETRNEFPTDEAADREVAKQIAAKLKKGYIEGALSAVPAREEIDWTSLSMSDDVFWQILGLFNWKKAGDDDAVIKPAIAALAQMSA